MRLRLAVPLLALLLLPAPASAATWSAGDARRDVMTYDVSPEPEPCGTYTDRAVPADRTTDITRLAVRHDAETVRIVVGFRSVVATESTDATIWLRTPDRVWEVSISRDEPWGRVWTDLSRMPDYEAAAEDAGECGVVMTSSGSKACRRLEGELDARRDRAVVVVPRTCVGDPRWVRAGVSSYGWDDEDPAATAHYDRWEPKGGSRTARIDGPYGPRVR